MDIALFKNKCWVYFEKGGDTNMEELIIATIVEEIKCTNVNTNLVVFPQRLTM